MSGPIDPVASATTQPPGAAQSNLSEGRVRLRATAGGTISEIEALRNRVYSRSPLSHYRTRDRIIIRIADIGLYSAIRAVCSTLKWEEHGSEHLEEILARGKRPIFTSWHVCIISATWFWRNRGIVVMSSTSRDAEYTGRVIKRFGYGTARGSATRGGGRALAEMAQCLENGIDVGFTIDGPRGPAYIAKPGAVTLARHTGQAILPFHITTSSSLTVRSWDRMQIPAPFSRAATFIGEPIYVPRNATGEEVAAKQSALQAALESLMQDGESWREQRKG